MTLKPTLNLLLLAALLVAPLTVHAIAPTALKTEFLENPLGIDTVKPRFSWIVEETTPGAKQTAYQVQVASSPEKLARGEADLWDSGKVASDETLGVEYGGQPLASRTFCWWRIRAWGGAGEESFWSKPTMFSVGLLQPQDWQGKWIWRFCWAAISTPTVCCLRPMCRATGVAHWRWRGRGRRRNCR